MNPKLAWLYQRAIICRTFPAYTLEELQNIPIVDILQALDLLDIARQAQEA